MEFKEKVIRIARSPLASRIGQWAGIAGLIAVGVIAPKLARRAQPGVRRAASQASASAAQGFRAARKSVANLFGRVTGNEVPHGDV